MSLPSDNNKTSLPLPPPFITGGATKKEEPIQVEDYSFVTPTVEEPKLEPVVERHSDSELTGNGDVFDTTSPMFDNVPRALVVNEQPFFRWLKRVFLAIIVASAFVMAVTWFVKAPLEIGLWAVLAVWIAILAYTAPEAIIPYKKTRFDLSDNTFRVGQKNPLPLENITNAYLFSDSKNIKLWLSINSSQKQGFYVPLKSSKFSMKREDLLALRTVIPYTTIEADNGVKVNLSSKNKRVPVSQKSILDLIEDLIK